MKKIFTIIAFIICVNIYWAQAPTINDDTTRIKTGDKTILIISDEEDDFDWEDECDSCEYDGIESVLVFDLGMNGYLTPDKSLTLPSSLNQMELDYSKSRAFSLNFMMRGADIANGRLYISPGVGFNWNSYAFKNNISISTGSDTTIFMSDSNVVYDKFKFKTTYLQIPLIVGMRLGNMDKTPVGIQFGAIGGYKIGSWVKQKYAISETKFKDRVKDDYNINPFKLDAIARVSIGSVGLYARYSLTSLFEPNKAPELYPFSIGFTFGGF